jgi:predicted dinucleotide-binding enzyme
MQIAVLGFGRMGRTVAHCLYAAGYDVKAGTRRPPSDPNSAEPFAILSLEAAITHADVVFLALPWPAALNVVREISPSLKRSAVIIDCTNPELSESPGLAIGTSTSGAEQLAALIGPCRVVKALNHVYAELLAEARSLPIHPTAFYCGGNTASKQIVESILRALDLHPVDAGPLTSARYLEPMSQVLVHLVRQQGIPPDAIALQLWTRTPVH